MSKKNQRCAECQEILKRRHGRGRGGNPPWRVCRHMDPKDGYVYPAIPPKRK